MSNESPTSLPEQHVLLVTSQDPKSGHLNSFLHGEIILTIPDPLNWPLPLKVFVLMQVSILSALGGINTAIINPAYVPMSKELRISVIKASYQTTTCIIINSFALFLWVPLSNKYGRRPILLGTTLLGFVSILGSAYAKSFSQLIAARVFNGFFPSAFVLGPSILVDLFFLHQRGRAMGVFTVTTVNGSHIAPLLGGPIGQFLGWRWCFKFAAICDAVMFLVIHFCLPETSYVQPAADTASYKPDPNHKNSSFLDGLKFRDRRPDSPLHFHDFVLPVFKMALKPHVIFPVLYYSTQYGFASIARRSQSQVYLAKSKNGIPCGSDSATEVL